MKLTVKSKGRDLTKTLYLSIEHARIHQELDLLLGRARYVPTERAGK
jgi:hypothetical protein